MGRKGNDKGPISLRLMKPTGTTADPVCGNSDLALTRRTAEKERLSISMLRRTISTRLTQIQESPLKFPSPIVEIPKDPCNIEALEVSQNHSRFKQMCYY
ncbi:hypothetical protein LIER_26009 [Lithospermum erythrorhizon]|uniref:Uncharacterized protein n=1 Tax=Lithospermum erythrorhizon TaxID=34254 RepID=A0AAV3RA89_LITER